MRLLLTLTNLWQQFFIDHTNKKTTYMDPRVPTEPSFVRRVSDEAQVRCVWCVNLFALSF